MPIKHLTETGVDNAAATYLPDAEDWDAEHVGTNAHAHSGPDDGGPLAEPAIRRAVVTIPSADVLTLHETPVEILPAPAEDEVILVLFAAMITGGTTGYVTGEFGGNAFLKYDGDLPYAALFDFGAAAASPGWLQYGSATNGGSANIEGPLSDAVGQGVMLSAPSGANEDGDGDWTVVLVYTTVPVPA